MINVGKKTIKLMLLITVVLSVAVGTFRFVVLERYIEPENGFYIRETNVDIVFNIAFVLLVLFVFACAFATRKGKSPDYLDSHSMVVVFTSALCAFMYITMFFYGVYTVVTGYGAASDIAYANIMNGANPGDFGVMFKLVNCAGKVSSNGIFFIIQLALCIPCFFNHFSICSKEIREKNTPHALLSMSEALFFAMRLVEIFMDTTAQINTSQRSLEVLMLTAMMMFFLFEAGFLVKRTEGEISLAKYLCAGLFTVALPWVALIPHLAVSLFSPMYESNCIVMDVLEGCIMLFAASRVLTLSSENV